MRVVRARAFGGPEVLVPGEASEPEPGSGELLVDVSVAEVLFLDTQLRAGWGRDYFPLEPPFVPGVGIAGSVAATGDGVDAGWVGQRVIASLSKAGEYRGGGYAERATAAADRAMAVPDGLELRDAIAALHDGLMGVSRVEKAQVARGETVLVTAAGGSIGTWLIPLLAGTGAMVVAAAHGEGKLSLARERGADITVDYSEDDWPARVRAATGEREVDTVFDGAGGQAGARAFELTGRGARFFSYGSASGEFAGIEAAAERRGVQVIGLDEQLTPGDRRRYAQDALTLLAAGEVRPVIGKVVPLERASEAHAAIEDRSVAGKTLLATGSRAAA
jgi:NADPH:quinone reductase